MTGLHAALAELRDEWLTLGESDVENQRDLWARADRITQILDLHEPSGQVDHEQAYNDLRASIEGLHREIARGPNAAELLGYCAHDDQRYPCLTIRTLPDPSDTATASEGATEHGCEVEDEDTGRILVCRDCATGVTSSDGDREGLSDEEIDSRMAKVSNAAIHAAEEVWSEDEPTVAEYELAQRVLDAARLVEVTAARDEADRLAIVANAVAAVTPCVCSAQRTRAEQAEARAEVLAEQVAAIEALLSHEDVEPDVEGGQPNGLGHIEPSDSRDWFTPARESHHRHRLTLYGPWLEGPGTWIRDEGGLASEQPRNLILDALAIPGSVLAARDAKVAAQARHVVHVTAEPVAEDAVWCEECEEWVTSGVPERAAGGEVEQP